MALWYPAATDNVRRFVADVETLWQKFGAEATSRYEFAIRKLAAEALRSTGTLSMPLAKNAMRSEGPLLYRMLFAAQRKPTGRSKVLRMIIGSMNWFAWGAIANSRGSSEKFNLWAPATATCRKNTSTQPFKKLQMSIRVDRLKQIHNKVHMQPQAVAKTG